MTKYLIFLGITLVALFTRCKSKESYSESGVAVLNGTILNPTAPVLVLDLNGSTREIPINQDGSFHYQLDIPSAGIHKLMHGPQGMFLNVYLQPGQTTTLKADGSNLVMSTKFEGETKVENQYLTAKMLNEPTLIQIDQTSLFTLAETEFLKTVEDVKTKLVEFKKEYQKQNGVFNPYFEEMINQDISYQVTNLKMFYPIYYNYLMRTTDFKPSENFYSFFQSLDMNNEINLNSDHFKAFVPLYLEHLVKFKNSNVENYESTGLDKLSVLSENFTSQKIKEEISFLIMKESFETSLAGAFAMYDVYMTQSQDPEKKKAIEQLQNQWLPLKPGNPAPSFSGVDKKGKLYTSEGLKGKVIYIDVWATWCGPCLAELPHLENLQTKFVKDANIHFVSISIDQTQEPWLKMLETKNMKGLQLFAEGAWNSDITTKYKISGIPRFIIIDKEGNIFDGNAPRPSNPATLEILTKLL